MTRPSYLRRTIASVILLIVSAVVVLCVYALSIRAQASRILQDISSLRVGISTQSDVERLAQQQKRQLAWKKCEAESCDYLFEIRNNWLYRMRIEPATRFHAWVTVADGRVKSLHADIMRDTRIFPTAPSGGMVEEYAKYPKEYRAGETHYGFPTPVGKPYLVVVLDSEATPEERRHAYAFSLTCLVKPGGGCDLPCDYLPLAWKDWEAELISRGFGFDGYYPSRARCE